MSVFSMTGFGAATVALEVAGLAVRYRVTVRSVNHRHLDVKCRAGRELASIERQVVDRVKARLHRGHVEVSIEPEASGPSPTTLSIDEGLLSQLYEQAASVAERLGAPPPEFAQLLRLPGVVESRRTSVNASEHAEELLAGVDDALSALVQMRATEGAALLEDLSTRAKNLAACADRVEAAVPALVEGQRARLRERIGQLVSDPAVLDAKRLELEVAVLADKSDVSEEITRVRSHLAQFNDELMREPAGSGKKLAFVTQELNREFNTIGSKIGDPPTTRVVIDARSELEKVREQVANLE